MTKITEIFSLEELQKNIDDGLVVARKHPTIPNLCILNYSQTAQFAKSWNTVTLNCRGLIYNTDTLDIVSRPFRKFFNYGDSTNTGQLDLDAPAIVTDKLDGSLGILYGDNNVVCNNYAIATRGSFESEQAIHATKIFHRKYNHLIIPEDITLLFEIVYPENRIVVDYGNTDDLILLGAVFKDNGVSIHPTHHFLNFWTGPRAEIFPYRTLREALTVTPRKNVEGLVVHMLLTGQRIKIKQDDYIALHKIVTGLNEKTIWEHLSADKTIAELLESLPDEFHDWTLNVASDFNYRMGIIAGEILFAFGDIIKTLPKGYARKEFAMLAKNSKYSGELFNLLDKNDEKLHHSIWQRLKPVGKTASPRMAHTEDNA